MREPIRNIEPPSWWRRALEMRWPIEASAFTALATICPVQALGDGHPVLVLPGFTASDRSTAPLRWALARHNFAVHPWELGRNLGPSRSIVDGMRRRLDELERSSGRRVSLVGWSLGGIYARALARERPDAVRQVITLGSPFRTVDGDAPLAVPATSIYTRHDGIVRWQTCIDETGPEAPNPRAENIEVHGTHVGLGVNPAVIAAVVDRLSQPEGSWTPFRPPLVALPWYPRPASWAPPRHTVPI